MIFLLGRVFGLIFHEYFELILAAIFTIIIIQMRYQSESVA